MCKYFLKTQIQSERLQGIVTLCGLIQHYNEIDFSQFDFCIGSTKNQIRGVHAIIYVQQ